MSISKYKKTVNNVEITLLKKSPSIKLRHSNLFGLDKNDHPQYALLSYVEDRLANLEIGIIQQPQTNTGNQLQIISSITQISQNIVIDRIGSTTVSSSAPEDSDYLTYDGILDQAVWRQFPDIPPDLSIDVYDNTARLVAIESWQPEISDAIISVNNTISNYESQFNTEWIKTKTLQVPFDSYDGNLGGIFFNNLTDTTAEHYSIKVGSNAGPSSGYSYGDVNDLAMRFTMSSNAGRGWVWSRVGPGVVPVMSVSNRGQLALASGLTFAIEPEFTVAGVSSAKNGWSLAYDNSDSKIKLINISGGAGTAGIQPYDDAELDGITATTLAVTGGSITAPSLFISGGSYGMESTTSLGHNLFKTYGIMSGNSGGFYCLEIATGGSNNISLHTLGGIIGDSNIKAGTDLYANIYNLPGGGSLYFHDGSIESGESLSYSTGDSRFEFSDTVQFPEFYVNSGNTGGELRNYNGESLFKVYGVMSGISNGFYPLEITSGTYGISLHTFGTVASNTGFDTYGQTISTGFTQRLISTYSDGAITTGTEIQNDTTWRYNPETVIGDNIDAKDFTIFWDDRLNRYHIISLVKTDNAETNTAATKFSWSTSTSLSASSFQAASGGSDQIGYITSITGSIDDNQVETAWAPHLIQHNSRYYMFYTGLDQYVTDEYNRQQIFCVVSQDIDDWDNSATNPISLDRHQILDGAAPWTTFNNYAVDGWTGDCRDPFVVWDDDTESWAMFVAIRLSGASEYTPAFSNNPMAIALATSTTLTSKWELVDWIKCTASGDTGGESTWQGTAESPGVFKGPDNLWYLYWSWGSSYYATDIRFATASTLMSTNYTRITDLDDRTDGLQGIANEVIPHPHIPDSFVQARIAGDYDIRFDELIQFTGVNLDICITGHQTMDQAVVENTGSTVNLWKAHQNHSANTDIHFVQSEIDYRNLINRQLEPHNVFIIGDNGVRTGFTATANTNSNRGQILIDAINFASSGNTIHVGPGDYECYDILRDQLSYYFEPGSRIVQNISGATSIFSDNAENITFVIDGFGEFINSGTGVGNQRVFDFQGTTSGTVRCKKISCVDGVAVRAADSGEVIIYADEIESKDGTFDNLSTDMILRIFARSIISTNGFVVEMDGGSTYINGLGGRAFLESQHSNPIEVASLGGECVVNNCYIKAPSGNLAVNVYGGSEIEFNSCRFESDEPNPIYVNGGSIVHTTNCSNVSGNFEDLVGGAGTWVNHNTQSTNISNNLTATTLTLTGSPFIVEGTITGDSSGFYCCTIDSGATDLSVHSLGTVVSDLDVDVGRNLHVDLYNLEGKIKFHDGSTKDGESLYYLTGDSKFVLSDDIAISGDITSTSSITVNQNVIVGESIQINTGNQSGKLYFFGDEDPEGFYIELDTGDTGFYMSSDINVHGHTESSSWIRTESNLIADQDLYLNYAGPDGDSFVYFYDDSSTDGEYLKWDDTENRFEFSNSTQVDGRVTSTSLVISGWPYGMESTTNSNNNIFKVYNVMSGNSDGVYCLDIASGGSNNISLHTEGKIVADTDIQAGNDIYVNFYNDPTNGKIYFWNEGDEDGAYIMLDTGNTRFEISTDTNITGDLYLNGDEISTVIGGGGTSIPQRIGFSIDGGGDAIALGYGGDTFIPTGGTIKSATILAIPITGTSGSVAVSLWSCVYDDYPPTSANTLSSGSPLSIVNDNKYQKFAFGDWGSATILDQSIIRADVTYCDNIKNCIITLEVE